METNMTMPSARRPPWLVPSLRPLLPEHWPADVLRQGDRDNDVKELQRALRSLGYDQIIDGRFGRTTLECVRSFQATHGLPRDGIVGAQTWRELQRLCTEVARNG